MVIVEENSDVLIICQSRNVHEWVLDLGCCFPVYSREMFDEVSLRQADETIR